MFARHYVDSHKEAPGRNRHEAGAPHDEKGRTMDKLEKAELIVEKTGVSFEDAKDALEANDYDVLDAIVWLERQGKTARQTASYNTAQEYPVDATIEMSQAQSDYERATKSPQVGKAFSRLMEMLRVGLKKCVDTSFVVRRKDEQVLAMPVLVLVLLLIFPYTLPITLLLLVVGLFADFKYRFEGIGSVTVDINEMVDKAGQGVENLKRDVMGNDK